MTTLRVLAIPTKVAELVRTTHRSPGYGHPAHTELATGYGPCRHCLRTFRVGEEQRTLFTYDPFHGMESFPLPGPVFIHREECVRYAEDAPFPEDLRTHALTFAAYARGRRLIIEQHVTDGRCEDVLRDLFGRADVDYVHVRDTDAGCYDFRVERATESASPT
jgi:hypothetical protein